MVTARLKGGLFISFETYNTGFVRTVCINGRALSHHYFSPVNIRKATGRPTEWGSQPITYKRPSPARLDRKVLPRALSSVASHAFSACQAGHLMLCQWS